MAHLRPRAEVDLLEIWDFVFQTGGIVRADTFVDRVLAACNNLDAFPEMGKSRANLAPNLRSLVEGNHLIFYVPTANGVEVVRILHGARDLEALLDDDPDAFR